MVLESLEHDYVTFFSQTCRKKFQIVQICLFFGHFGHLWMPPSTVMNSPAPKGSDEGLEFKITDLFLPNLPEIAQK